jgi:uncharacterized membrane protein
MQTVTLQYSLGGTQQRTFNVYGITPLSYRLVKKSHEGINGGLQVNPVGHIPRFRIDFAPLEASKESAWWLAGMLQGTNRQIEIDSVTYRIIPLSRSLSFDFGGGVFFNDRCSIEFEHNEVLAITDTGSTLILKPTYTPGVATISGSTLTISCNLVDDISTDHRGPSFSYIDTTEEEEWYCFRHIFSVNFGAVLSSTVRAWLLDYSLWNLIQLDTRLIDPVNGQVFTVVNDSDVLQWDLQNGVIGCHQTSMMLKEKTARTALQAGTGGSPFILDQDTLDSKPLG